MFAHSFDPTADPLDFHLDAEAAYKFSAQCTVVENPASKYKHDFCFSVIGADEVPIVTLCAQDRGMQETWMTALDILLYACSDAAKKKKKKKAQMQKKRNAANCTALVPKAEADALAAAALDKEEPLQLERSTNTGVYTHQRTNSYEGRLEKEFKQAKQQLLNKAERFMDEKLGPKKLAGLSTSNLSAQCGVGVTVQRSVMPMTGNSHSGPLHVYKKQKSGESVWEPKYFVLNHNSLVCCSKGQQHSVESKYNLPARFACRRGEGRLPCHKGDAVDDKVVNFFKDKVLEIDPEWYSFEILDLDRDNRVVVSLGTSSAEQRAVWVKALKVVCPPLPQIANVAHNKESASAAPTADLKKELLPEGYVPPTPTTTAATTTAASIPFGLNKVVDKMVDMETNFNNKINSMVDANSHDPVVKFFSTLAIETNIVPKKTPPKKGKQAKEMNMNENKNTKETFGDAERELYYKLRNYFMECHPTHVNDKSFLRTIAIKYAGKEKV